MLDPFSIKPSCEAQTVSQFNLRGAQYVPSIYFVAVVVSPSAREKRVPLSDEGLNLCLQSIRIQRACKFSRTTSLRSGSMILTLENYWMGMLDNVFNTRKEI